MDPAGVDNNWSNCDTASFNLEATDAPSAISLMAFVITSLYCR